MERLKVFFYEIIMFILIQLLGIYTAYNLFLQRAELPVPELSLLSFGIAFAVATIFIVFAVKFFKGTLGFKLLFIFLIIIGARIVFETQFHMLVATLLAFFILAIWLLGKNVLTHNIAIILAIAGISAEVGLAMTVPTILILITALSVYDVIAVYKTKHMVTMFKKLVHKGVFLAIIIPFKAKDFLKKTKYIEPGKNFVMLGTGDLAFPLIFASAVMKTSLTSALFIIAGATIGVALIYVMLITQVQRRALPALPPIALCSIVAFLISIYI